MNILATDFAQHFKNMEKFKSLVPDLDKNCKDDKNRYVNIILFSFICLKHFMHAT